MDVSFCKFFKSNDNCQKYGYDKITFNTQLYMASIYIQLFKNFTDFIKV